MIIHRPRLVKEKPDARAWKKAFAWLPAIVHEDGDKKVYVWLDTYEWRRYYDDSRSDNYFTGNITERFFRVKGENTQFLVSWNEAIESGDRV